MDGGRGVNGGGKGQLSSRSRDWAGGSAEGREGLDEGDGMRCDGGAAGAWVRIEEGGRGRWGRGGPVRSRRMNLVRRARQEWLATYTPNISRVVEGVGVEKAKTITGGRRRRGGGGAPEVCVCAWATWGGAGGVRGVWRDHSHQIPQPFPGKSTSAETARGGVRAAQFIRLSSETRISGCYPTDCAHQLSQRARGVGGRAWGRVGGRRGEGRVCG